MCGREHFLLICTCNEKTLVETIYSFRHLLYNDGRTECKLDWSNHGGLVCPVRAPFLLLNLIIEFFKKKKTEVRGALFLDNFKRLSIVCKKLLSNTLEWDKIYLIRRHGIAEYFYGLCRILTSPWSNSIRKQLIKILSDTTHQNVQ